MILGDQRCRIGAFIGIFFVFFLVAFVTTLVLPSSAPGLGAIAQAQASSSLYETRTVHDPNGTGKFYMGREIAQVMGPGGIPWLDRPERESEEKPAEVLKAMNLHGNEVVADLGAGSGYFSFRLAAKVGKVLAVEIQDEMIATLRERIAEQKIGNVEVIKGAECDPRLPPGGVDLVLMVDVYHELACPFEVMTQVGKALKPGGRVVFVEYRKEDPKVQIKEVHKMSVAQLEKEMKVVKLARVQTVEVLPWQHIVIFAKGD